jgi:hypothetical protein
MWKCRLGNNTVQWREFVQKIINFKILQEQRIFVTSWENINFVRNILHGEIN